VTAEHKKARDRATIRSAAAVVATDNGV